MNRDHDLPPMAPIEPGRDAYGRTPRPPYDPTVQLVVDATPYTSLTADTIAAARANRFVTRELVRSMFGVEVRTVACPGYDGATISCEVIRRPDDDEVGPGFFWIHGGGMVTGDAIGGVIYAVPHLLAHGGTIVSVDYRLAPEHPAPTPVEDCYAALVWAVSQAADLGFDPARVILGGGSAGGGLAAGVALLGRDRNGPTLLGALLACPMLDDRNDSLSIQQYEVGHGWGGRSNEVGWTALLGDRRGTAGVSPYDAPARAPWLGGLPPLHIAVGSADPFRDEDVAFAQGVWRDGGDCELYVLPGGQHGYEGVASTSSIAEQTVASRAAWVRRLLMPDDLDAARAHIEQIQAALTSA